MFGLIKNKKYRISIEVTWSFFGKMLSLPFSEKSYTVVVEQLITTGTEEERKETAEIKKHKELKELK